MASMMDEMQKTLARRRAKVDRSSEEPDSDKQENGDSRHIEKSSSPGKPFSQPGSQAGSESPKPGRRRHSTRGSICGQEPGDIMSTSLGPGLCTGTGTLATVLPCSFVNLYITVQLLDTITTIYGTPCK